MTDETKSTGVGKFAFDVTRKIPLALSAREKWRNAATKLLAVEPIHEVNIDQHGRLRISYDASFIGIRDIEALLDELGVARASSFWWRMISCWYRYVDENAQANACSTGGACCNRPPSAYGSSRVSREIKQWHIHD